MSTHDRLRTALAEYDRFPPWVSPPAGPLAEAVRDLLTEDKVPARVVDLERPEEGYVE